MNPDNSLRVLLIGPTNLSYYGEVLDFTRQSDCKSVIIHHIYRKEPDFDQIKWTNIYDYIIFHGANLQMVGNLFPYIPMTSKPAPILAIIESFREDEVISFSRNLAGVIFPNDKSMSVTSALKAIEDNGTPISAKIIKIMRNQRHVKHEITNARVALTRQQETLLKFMSEDKQYKHIAKEMSLSIHTVHSYSRALFKRLNVHSRQEAVREAKALNILD